MKIQRPTEPGFYWYSWDGKDLEICEVAQGSEQLEVMLVGNERCHTVSSLACKNSFWIGPITRPDVTEG